MMMNPHIIAMMVVAVTTLTWRTGVTAPTDPGKASSPNSNVSEGVLLGCKDNPSDIYFLLDCSSSVWMVDFEKQKKFVVSMIERLDISPNATRVGLGVFSSDFFHTLDIGGYPNKDILIRAVLSASYFSGDTYTGKALHGMRVHGFRAGIVRPNVTKIGVVITDGRSRHRTSTIDEARKAREEQGIWLFAVGVGKNVDDEELSAIASVPKNQFIFHVESFDKLSTLTTTLANSTCNLAQPHGDGAACGGRKKRADVMFVYNAGATGSQQLRLVQDFVAHVVSQLSMATGQVRVGIVSKGSQGGDINLDQYLRPHNLIAALKDQPKGRLAPLFKKLRLQSFDPIYGARENVGKHIIAFVDDVMHDPNDVLYEALLLKYDDTLIHVLTVGDTVDRSQVNRMASSPAHITQFDFYTDLQTPAKRKEFLDKFCAGL